MPALNANYGFLLVALVIFAGELGIPTFLPGEIGLLLVGMQLVHSPAALVAVIVLFAVVDLIATSILHLTARSGGNRLLKLLLRRLRRSGKSPEETLGAWRARVEDNDVAAIFVGRMIPVMRMYVSLTSGLLRLRLRDFMFGAAPAALIWAAVPLGIGFLLQGSSTTLARNYMLVLHIFLAASVVLSLSAATLWWARRGRRRVGDRPAGIKRSAA